MTEDAGRQPATVREARDLLAIGLDPPEAGDRLSAAAQGTDGAAQ
jgi:hypothetical protein